MNTPGTPPADPTAPDDSLTGGLDVDRWVRRLELLADPTRLRLLHHMHLRPGSTVGELADAASITPTAASQALRVLRDQGWVTCAPDGRIRRYDLVDDTAHRLLHFMGVRHRRAPSQK